MVSLKQLRYLVVLSELKNFSRAAESCFVTQSTLSGGIQDLEDAIGVRLFERTKRKVLPTPAGIELTERAKRTLAEAEGFMEAARTHIDPFTGVLKLGVIPTIGPFLLPRFLSILRHEYPSLKLVLQEDQTAKLLAQLDKGGLDLLILAFPYEASDIQQEMFMDDPFWVACPKGHPLAKKKTVAISEVPQEELLLLGEGHCLRDHALAACQLDARPRKEEIQGTSLYTLLHMVANGLGVTLVPNMAVKTPLLAGLDIDLVPMGKGTPDRKIGFAWRRSSGRSDAYKQIGEVLAAAL